MIDGQIALPVDEELVRLFAVECLEFDKSYQVPIQDTYLAYKMWCESRGAHPTSIQWFGRRLHMFANLGHRHLKSGGQKIRFFTGLRLK